MTQHNLTRACVAGFSLTALAALLIACSDGDSGPSPATTFSGKVVDGYISGASVGVVKSDVCVFDTPPVTTNATGDYTLPIANQSSVLCATGGTDVVTGVSFVGKELRAPAGSTVVTPLTTLVQAQLAASSALTARTAADNIAKTLGLTGVDLLTADPVATAPAATASAASTLIQVTAAVQTLLDRLGTTYSAAVAGLASAIAKQTTVNLAGTDTTLATLIQNAASAASAALTAASATAIQNAVVATAAQQPASLATTTTTLAGTTTTSSGATTSTSTSTTTTTTTTTILAPLKTLAVSAPTINGKAATAASAASTAGAADNPYIVVGPVTSASLALDGTAGTSITTSVGFDITSTVCGMEMPGSPGSAPTCDGRKALTLIVDNVTLTKSTTGAFTGVVNSGAKLYASATNNLGLNVTVVKQQTNNSTFNALNFSGNILSVNWLTDLSNALATAGLGSLNLNTGTYDVKAVVNGVTLAGSNAAAGVVIPAVGAASGLTGAGVSFRVTVN